MANELTLNVTLAYNKNNVAVTESVVNFLATVTGNGLNSLTSYSAPLADTALPLGSVTAAGGWLFILNTDAANYVQLKTAVGGTIIARIKAGYPCLIPLDASITAPSTVANTNPVILKYAIFDL